MKTRFGWGLAAVLGISASLGCTQVPSVVRGQSPAECPPGAAAAGAGGMPGALPAGAAVAGSGDVATYGPPIGAAPGYGQSVKHDHPYHNFVDHYSPARDHRFGYNGGYYAGPNGYWGGCHAGQPGYPYGCQPGINYHAGANGHMFPYHYNTYHYNWPDDLVYPPPVQPAAMVQYPYYTLRGPSDFFMK